MKELLQIFLHTEAVLAGIHYYYIKERSETEFSTSIQRRCVFQKEFDLCCQTN